MIVVMDERATDQQIDDVVSHLVEAGVAVHRLDGTARTLLGVVAAALPDQEPIAAMAGVHRVLRISSPYKLASRAYQTSATVVTVGGAQIGGAPMVVMAGPCAVESEEQVFATAAIVRKAGAEILRGGAFKPRSSPYSFQGLGRRGLELLRAAADHEGMPVISEVMDVSQIDLVARYADILQVGARNMQNFTLLKELGRIRKPVLVKRAVSATIEEWLLSAEYVLSGGNSEVVLCERGIRTFETATRNTLDLSAIHVVKTLSHLPVIVDPSHGTGRRDHVAPMARAAIAAGADGLLIEVHCDPDQALCDGMQSLQPAQFADLMDELRLIASTLHRRTSAHVESLTVI